MNRYVVSAAFIGCAWLTSACGGGSSTSSPAQPSIGSFVASKATITTGGSTTITAVFSNGAGSIDQGIGVVTSGLPITVSPAATTTYTLTVTGGTGGPLTASATVAVVPPPSITSFTASAEAITAGESVTLTAFFSEGGGFIDPSPGVVISGTSINVSPSTTTTYSLDVTNAAGDSATSTVTVVVFPAPVVASFVAAKPTMTTGGGTTLTPIFSGGVGSIDHAIGIVTSSTPVAVSPAATTTYTLSVTNDLGASATASATVAVVPPPSISAFAASKTLITSGDAITLTASFENGQAIVDHGIGVVASGVPVTAFPAATATYALVVTNPAGDSISATVTVTVVPAPSIASFLASKTTITVGATVTLTGTFANGTGSVDHGVGLCTSGAGVLVSPSATNTYTLLVTNAAGRSTSATVTVTVVPAPSVAAFGASKGTITSGATLTLTATFWNGTAFIDHAVGAVTSGVSVTVSPTSTTIYTLLVTNPAGDSVTDTVTVTVVPAPSISSFAVSKGTITVGTTATLTPSFSNGTGSIDQGVGTVTSGVAVPVTPPATTTYTLRVTNAAGDSTSATVSVVVAGLAGILGFTASKELITVGTYALLIPDFMGGVGSIDQGVGAATSGHVVEVYPTTTTTYTLTVTNAAGDSVTASVTITVVPAPVILAFAASRSIVTSGDSITLTFSFQGGTGSIDNGVGAVVAPGNVTVTPAPGATYTLTVVNAALYRVFQTVSVGVVPAPHIDSLTVEGQYFRIGGHATVTATYGNGSGVLWPSNISVVPGTPYAISPKMPSRYVLEVTNAAGAKVARSFGVFPSRDVFASSYQSGLLDHLGYVWSISRTSGRASSQPGFVSPGGLWADGTLRDPDGNIALTVGSAPVVQIEGGRDYDAGFTATLLADGTVWTWGANNRGQLGDGTYTDRATPAQVPGLPKIVTLSVGGGYTLALDEGGGIWAWGDNRGGQLGDGTIDARTAPICSGVFPDVVSIRAGSDAAAFIDRAGIPYLWGGQYASLMGDGFGSRAPTRFGALGSIASIDMGVGHTLVIASDGTAWAWGYTFYGQVGTGSFDIAIHSPQYLSVLGETASLACGDYHSMAIRSDGTIYTWGHNSSGQLGDGSTLDRSLPLIPAGVSY